MALQKTPFQAISIDVVGKLHCAIKVTNNVLHWWKNKNSLWSSIIQLLTAMYNMYCVDNIYLRSSVAGIMEAGVW